MSSNRAASDPLTARLRDAVETLLEPESSVYTELTVGAICAQAGISRPTFYARFSDKVDLIRTMAADTINELVDVSAYWLDAPKADRAQLEQAMARLVDAYTPHRHVMAAAAEVAAYDADLNSEFAAVVEHAARRVADHIRDGQKKGFTRGHLDPAATARWLGWMTERGLRRCFEQRASATAAAVATLTDIHWFTLYEGVP